MEPVKAQNYYDFLGTDQQDFYFNENEDPVPVCMTKKYRDFIDLKGIRPAYIFEPINNDSMYQQEYDAEYYREANERARRGLVFITSTYEKVIDVSINFKEEAFKIDIDEGTLWIFRINSTTAISLGASFKESKIPDGARLSLFYNNYDHDYSSPNVRLGDMYIPVSLRLNIQRDEKLNDVYIEYFEPKNAAFSPELIIDKLIYGYGNQGRHESLFQENLLKGAYGKTTKECNNDIVCQVGEPWKN